MPKRVAFFLPWQLAVDHLGKCSLHMPYETIHTASFTLANLELEALPDLTQKRLDRFLILQYNLSET